MKTKKFDLIAEAIKIADEEFRQIIEGCCQRKLKARSKALYEFDIKNVDDLFKEDVKDALSWFAERNKATNIKSYGEMSFTVTTKDGYTSFKENKKK